MWIYSVQIEKIVGKIFEENYKLRDSISDCIKYYTDNKKFLLNAITHTSGQNSFINNMTRINLKVFLDFIKINNGLEEIPKDIEILSKIYVYGTVCASYEWLVDKNPVEFEKFIELLEKSLPEKLKKYFYKKSQA